MRVSRDLPRRRGRRRASQRAGQRASGRAGVERTERWEGGPVERTGRAGQSGAPIRACVCPGICRGNVGGRASARASGRAGQRRAGEWASGRAGRRVGGRAGVEQTERWAGGPVEPTGRSGQSGAPIRACGCPGICCGDVGGRPAGLPAGSPAGPCPKTPERSPIQLWTGSENAASARSRTSATMAARGRRMPRAGRSAVRDPFESSRSEFSRPGPLQRAENLPLTYGDKC